MKTIQLLSLAIISVATSSCAVVHDRLNTGTILRDCTGTYLRVGNNEDYLICNAEAVASKKEGEKVSLIFDYTKTCTQREGKIMCMMYHENKGMIMVKDVK